MLPDAFPAVGRAPVLFVALGDEAIVGAAALAWVPRGFPVLVHVVEAHRRIGLGRALLDAAAQAATGETACLRAWMPVTEDSGEMRFLARAGFVASKRLLRFETEAVRFERSMTALLQRIHPRIPADVRLLPLAQADPDPVVRLVAPQLAVFSHDVAARLVPGSRTSFDPDLSFVLMHGTVLAGAILCRRVGNVIEVEANAVAEPYRRGWANLMLVEAVTRVARATPGIDLCRFAAEEHVTDTVNMGRRTEAKILPALVLMTRPLYSAAAA